MSHLRIKNFLENYAVRVQNVKQNSATILVTRVIHAAKNLAPLRNHLRKPCFSGATEIQCKINAYK